MTIQFEGYIVMCVCCRQSIPENYYSNYISRYVASVLHTNEKKKKKKINNGWKEKECKW